MLNVGEYELPKDCRALVAGGKVYVFKRIIRGRRKGLRLHCGDCKHRIEGYACNNSFHKTYVCELRPKSSWSNKKKLFYAVGPYGDICDKFEKV